MTLPQGVKIREPRRGGGDRDWIYRLLGEMGVVVAPSDQSNTLTWVISHPENEIFVAVDPLDRGVGFLAFSHRPQLRIGGRIATIDELIVTPAMRRKGIGTELLEKGIARAKMLGCKRVEIAAPDEASRAYLEHRGFTGTSSTIMGWRNIDAR